MKTLNILILAVIFSLKIQAQTTITTTTITVKGNCGECKDRIENAADIIGVKNATWEEKTQVLSVTYDSQKVSLAQIEEAIAKAGHTTTNKVADNKSYKKLPDCCKYEQGTCKEK
ncbi:MAG: heavy-metal-associated domain-containing protein [Bacteroidia bacterium]